MHRRVLLASCLAAASMLLGACRHVAPAPLSPEQSAAALASRRLDDPGLREFLRVTLEPPPSSWPLPRWDVASLTLAALYYQPGLDVARAQWRAAEAAIESAGARPNPTLSIAPELSSNPDPGISPWLAAVHLDWTLETAGKRGRRVGRAQALASSARYALATEAWRVRRALRQALLDWAAAQERGALLARAAEDQRVRVDLVDARVGLGAASEVDLTPARLDWIQATADLADARRLELGARARIAAALAVPAAALEEIDLDFSLADEGAELRQLGAAGAVRTALYTRADVLAALADYSAAEQALALELAKQYPDVHLGNGYQFDQGQNKWALGLFVELPLLSRNEGPIAEAEAARRQAAARFVALQASVLAEVERALADRGGADAEVKELEGLVAERRDQLERARSAFALGAVDRLALVAARVELVRGELALTDARARLQQALGDLEAAVQGPLLRAQMLEGRASALPGAGPS